MIIICPKCGLEGKSKIDINTVKKLKCRKCHHIFSIRSIQSDDVLPVDISLADSPTIVRPPGSATDKHHSAETHIITVKNGIDQGQTFELNKLQNIIGRKNADITLHDPMISRQHASIEIFDSNALLKDLGSSNGIFYNGKRIKIVILHNGDTIQLGETVLEYKCHH